jgi:hypothetical protein
MKNGTTPDSPWYAPVKHTLGLLRVMESVRAAEGDEPIGRLYTVYGEQLHHRGNRELDATTALTEAALDPAHAAAYDDESFDAIVRAGMDEGLALVGNDVGTPIIGFNRPDGSKVGFFGPVMSRRLPLDQALQMWDGLTLMTGIDAFWELKRTRTENPDFTPPPAPTG